MRLKLHPLNISNVTITSNNHGIEHVNKQIKEIKNS